MSTRFFLHTGKTDQENFDQHFEQERSSTLYLAGKTEETLTDEQRSALDAYITAQKDFHLATYGLAMPRGNSLSVESSLESTTRGAWEESIKPAWLKLKERVEAVALQYWQEHIEQDLQGVRLSGPTRLQRPTRRMKSRSVTRTTTA